MTKFAPLAASLAAALLAAGTLQPAEAKAPAGSLTITPAVGSYTGGSQLTLKGSLGVSGRRAIIVQRHMNRPGDGWSTIPDVKGHTRADGTFTITAPASAMRGLSYRVSSGRVSSPSRLTNSKAQEAFLSQGTTAVAGKSFRLDVDTVGARFNGYDDLPAPVLPGRGVTLQRRVNGTDWIDVATSQVSAKGTASFETTLANAGTASFRALLHDWTQNGDAVGWTTSFPLDVRTYATPRAARAAGLPRAIVAPSDPLPAPSLASSGVRRHAAVVNGWVRSRRLGYEWEYGESLTSPSYFGSAGSAVWDSRSDGTGRSTMRNGGLLFSTDGYGSAPDGAAGDVWATLSGGGASRLGRWETRGSTTQRSGSGQAYRVRYELVPAAEAGKRCTSSSIVIAETAGPGSAVKFGVRNAKGSWAGSRRLSTTPGASSFAVQVTKKHVTWFLNGSPVGTVRSKAAVPGKKMTVRISLLDAGDVRMQSAKSTVDWVRAYTLKYGKKPTSKKALRKGGAVGGC